MYIPEFPPIDTQRSCIGVHEWSVARLIELSKSLPVLTIPLDHLNIYHKYKSLTLRDMVMHFKTVLAADLTFPIILDEDGEIMDGRHRIMKAILEERPTILAVRFDKNPYPCQILEQE